MLAFEPQAHVYRWEGVVRPSVTQVQALAAEQLRGQGLEARADELATDYSKVPRELLERASVAGSMVHSMLHHYVRLDESERPTQIVEPRIEPRVVGCVNAGLRFLSEVPLRLIHAERRLYSPRLAVAGTLDLAAWFAADRTIFDWKTTSQLNVEASHVQEAAYALLLEHDTGETVSKTITVHLRPDGRYRLHPCRDLPAAKARFLWALQQVRGVPSEEWLATPVPEAA